MLTIISTEKINGLHPIESQSGRTSVWLDGYIEVPEHLIEKAWESCGYCNLVFDEDGNLADIEPTEKPVMPDTPTEPTTEERLAALETAIAEGLKLYEGGSNE